ncbi:MAG: TetR/AcrR family transcriptional regulator [Lachnospiraceae bacterium]|nr:TetR/AcrR family transcriptional regulator [Lachnospiraceae bacterium]
METKPYHHGDLRHSLIETGIELIGEYGEDKLSLRKVAMKCGVSNAAPYAHFQSKDEFIAAIQQHIMDMFINTLETAIQENLDSPSLLMMLGKAYVMFFYKHPLYYDFLFSRKNIKINLSLGSSGENQPLDILKKAAMQIFGKTNMPESVIQDKVIAMWALVQGLSAIVTMQNVEYTDNWEAKIEDIIKAIAMPC